MRINVLVGLTALLFTCTRCEEIQEGKVIQEDDIQKDDQIWKRGLTFFGGTDWEKGMKWCYHKRSQLFTGDFNGDGKADMLCHDNTGYKWVALANSKGQFTGTSWEKKMGWCYHKGAQLFTGDFNGDGRTDILCHDRAGYKWVALANSAGQFTGTSWHKAMGWCSHSGAKLLIGDFNGDGRDDMLCYDNNRKWVSLAQPGGSFKGTSWEKAGGWCSHSGSSIYVGDFNGDKRDDLMCHDTAGKNWVMLAQAGGSFSGSSSWHGTGWCGHKGSQFFIGYFNGDRKADMLCHDINSGHKWISVAKPQVKSMFTGTDWEKAMNWCGKSGKLYKADFNGDGEDDLLCHRYSDGYKWISYNRYPTKSPCSPNPCENGGKCADDRGQDSGYRCVCRSGFSGARCQSDINECKNNPCQNGGDCVNKHGSHLCNCKLGWTGKNCEKAKPFFVGTDWEKGMKWCYHKGSQLFTGDFNGDGKADMLCHDNTGYKWVALANSKGQFTGTSWEKKMGWCYHKGAQLFTGDFNGDGRTDILCHDRAGYKWVALANSAGQFTGTSWHKAMGWCSHSGAKLLIGDFNGDGRDDMLCYDNNRKWVSLAQPGGSFKGTSWEKAGGWCSHSGSSIYVGDFNGDKRDDLMCHDTAGKSWVMLAQAGGSFSGSSSWHGTGWCGHKGSQFFIGYFNGDRKADMLCHDINSGHKWISVAKPQVKSMFTGTDWEKAMNWCGKSGKLYKADFNGDGEDDLLCHRYSDGYKWISYNRYPTKSPCSPNPCENGGICADDRGQASGYRCVCRSGFSGARCQSDINECKKNPCQNGGDCVNKHGSHLCNCKLGWTGKNCEKAKPFFVGTDWEKGMKWCYHKGSQLFTGDFNGDGKADMLCHDNTGYKWVALANSKGQFTGTSWEKKMGWCYHKGAQLFTGDFNGDGRTDILCHDRAGYKWVALANSAGQFTGTSWHKAMGWCSHSGAKLLIGDFNGDGRDDMLCYDNNRKWVSLAQPGGSFKGTSWEKAGGWCSHSGSSIYVGDFNGDKRDDLMCHDTAGKSWVMLAQAGGSFSGSSSWHGTGWCGHKGSQFFIGYFNGDRKADMLCHDINSGHKWISVAKPQVKSMFTGTDWEKAMNWCGKSGKLYKADFNGDGEDDLLCHRYSDGYKWISYNRYPTKSPCSPNPCENGGKCADDLGQDSGYRCVCRSGFSGARCQSDINECKKNPCQNGGDCVNKHGSHLCNCKLGWTGKNCEEDVNECASSNPCKNGGVCTNSPGGYSCKCASGYTGKNCEKDVNECASSNPCKNGGVCTNSPGGYSCKCASGYTGKNCKKDVNECASSNPCKNGGVCTNSPGGYSCKCASGYTGKNCEKDVNECASSNPCKNGGVCANSPGRYSCECASGYTGKNCEIDVNECASSNPCKNGGVCTNSPGGYSCKCASGYTGKNCEKDEDKCKVSPCQNGGKCINSDDGYSCECKGGYSGKHCETEPESPGKTKYASLGCFKDNHKKKRPFPKMIVNLRPEIIWTDMKTSVVDKCAKAAKAEGFKYFGIQFHGECYSGPDAEVKYDKDGKAPDNKCWSGVGGENALFVYELD
ncbi:neurogenic locus notch homolog protein 1 isoform X2 [Nematostella vectensis]|uniref:neurogenic locus notch homolog protein 1 isoform X2 n=1 Tax=Nematostella vectensis TaxID=45351 RepID=UPI00207763F6|nr:neurogenic locus notch homolog protein 1 isoform X2 [Nematostella vectensis]